jgi:hypothetical protein
LYDLADNKNATIFDMWEAGWGVDGEAWKWRRSLRAWEEELVRECIMRLSNVVLQDNEHDRWVWKLHSSHVYSVQSAYDYLTATDENLNAGFDKFLWLKSVPLKVNLFVWRLFLNRLPTKDNLHRRGVLGATQITCVSSCGSVETADHLFFLCDFYGQLWHLLSNWLGTQVALSGSALHHSAQFCGLGGGSRRSTVLLLIIWVAAIYAIWNDRNKRIFKDGNDSLATLLERIKLYSFWWLKSSYVLFDFDYSFWRQNPLLCCQAIV